MPNKELRDLYKDDYVQAYHSSPGRRLRRLLPFLNLTSEMTVADFGCGNGLLLEAIHDRVSYYHGVDFSAEFISAARLRQERLSIANASFYCESIGKFCARHHRQFDCAFAMDFSEHIHDDDFIEISKAVFQSLKPKGRFYLHTPNAKFLVEIFKEKGIMRQFPEHIAVRSARQMESLLNQAGFRNINITSLPHYMPELAWLHACEKIPFVGKYFQARLFIECIL